MKFSVVILTHNEENNILDCLENLRSVDEIVIVDDNSTDRTIEIIKNLGRSNIRIYKRKLNSDFSKQRNFGLEKCRNNWVLFVDADERVSTALFYEIDARINASRHNGYKIRRTDVLWGKKLKFGETGDISLLRFARKNAGRWQGRVHEKWDIRGRSGKFTNEILHYPHQKVREFLSEVNFYSTIRARELREQNVHVSALSIIFYTKTKFFLNYFVKLGFLDGIPGLIFAIMMSLHSFLTRSKLWLLWNLKK